MKQRQRKLTVLGTVLSLIMGFASVSAMAAEDPFQRYIIFKNDSPVTVWPVVVVPYAANSTNEKSTQEGRIYVNKGGKDLGIPAGQELRINIPKNGTHIHSWYKSARVYLFTVAPTKLEEAVAQKDAAPKGIKDGVQPSAEICPGQGSDACWTATTAAGYWKDAPAQIIEYTALSKDWTGQSKNKDGSASGEYADQDDKRGDPFFDIDVSYVDDVYLPVSINLADGGATGYMGTTLSTSEFTSHVNAFLQNKQNAWQNYAAYEKDNWNYSVFKKIANPVLKNYEHLPAGYNLMHEVLVQSTTNLYNAHMISEEKRKAGNNPACAAIIPKIPDDVLMCPNDRKEMLACCDGGIAYMIGQTTKNMVDPNAKPWNKSLDAMYKRWEPWIDESKSPCSSIGSIGSWPSTDPKFDKAQFCKAFQNTVKWVWDKTKADTTAQAECSNAGKDPKTYNLCMVGQIVGYKVGPNHGQWPESVQALMRNVPWGTGAEGNPDYQWDKFLHFWAPYDSVFNLNPYITLVKQSGKKGGLGSMSGYSFSIDDLWGNYQDFANGMIVNIGGSSALLNKEQFNPYQKYHASFGAGWDRATVCGREIPNLTAQIGNTLIGKPVYFSMWRNSQKQKNCEIVVYKGDNHLSYLLEEQEKSVVDTWTGRSHKVKGIRMADANYCQANSSPVFKGLCDAGRSQLIPELPADNGTGKELVYVSVKKEDRPKTTLIVPAP